MLNELKEEIIYGDFLVAYFDKNTNEYKNYETVYNFSKEKILGYLEKYNSDSSNDKYAKIYEDEVIVKIAEDCKNSYSNKCLIEDIKDKLEMLSDTISSIEYRIDEIEQLYGGEE